MKNSIKEDKQSSNDPYDDIGLLGGQQVINPIGTGSNLDLVIGTNTINIPGHSHQSVDIGSNALKGHFPFSPHEPILSIINNPYMVNKDSFLHRTSISHVSQVDIEGSVD